MPKKKQLVYVASILFALLLAIGWNFREYARWPSGPRPPIILITVDTLRWDYLGCYGHPRPTSPNIDRFAGEALRFENCFSHAPVTSSSCASILSGFLPHETMVFENWPVPQAVETLPEMLEREGYRTAGVVCNMMLVAKKGWSQGFTVFDDTMLDHELNRKGTERVAESATDRAIELLEQSQGDEKPLFLWVHYQDPHGPYTPPDGYGEKFRDSERKPRPLAVNDSPSGHGGIPTYQKLGSNTDFHYYKSQYEGEIRYLDDNIGRLIDALKRTGIYDDALIVFTADHGEGMGEHDYFFAHGENLMSTLIHVPLIIRQGDRLHGVRSEFVQHVDIVPTVLDTVGISVDAKFRGQDVREPIAEKRAIFAETQSQQGRMYSVSVDGLQLEYIEAHRQYRLFDLKTDPYQENDLLLEPKYREPAEQLGLAMKRVRQENLLSQPISRQPYELSGEEIRKMKSMGYLK